MNAAVRRAARYSSTNAPQRNAPVHRLETDSSRDVVNRDTAVVCCQGKVGAARYKDLVAHVPLIIVARLRPLGANIESAGFDPHLLRQQVRFGLSRRARFNFRSDQYFIALPAFNRDAAVLFSVDSDGAARGQGLFLDLAMAVQSIIV